MKYAIIENGLVVNLIELADQSVLPDNEKFHVDGDCQLVQTDTGKIGDTFSSGVFTSPAPPAPSAAELLSSLVLLAKSALAKSDLVIIRCAEHGVIVTQEWIGYRSALRAIVNGTDTTSTALPTRPSYPAGT